jgi:FKBP-type peptidyl-prolyl cis-trans isomerase (trigger factor)
MEKRKGYKIKKTADLATAEKEIEIEIEWPELVPYREKVVQKIGASAELPGFRKGHVPARVIAGKIGEINLIEEALDLWIKNQLSELLTAEAPEAAAMPKITVVKLAPGNPVELRLTVALKPKLSLADYKKIAGEENGGKTEVEEAVDEKEIAETLKRFRHLFAKPKTETGQLAEKTELSESELPELTDDLVKRLGEFKNVADFKTKVREGLIGEKKQRAAEKRRLAIMDKIVGKTRGIIAPGLIDGELEKMESEFMAEVGRRGFKFEDYLKQIKKTAEDLKKEWRADAERRVKVRSILGEIGSIEKIKPAEEAVETELKHFLEHHKDADPKRARNYIEKLLTNEAVFKFLESQRQSTES